MWPLVILALVVALYLYTPSSTPSSTSTSTPPTTPPAPVEEDSTLPPVPVPPSPSPVYSWSEWVLDGPEPTCGAGEKKYTRKCTLNSVIQATTDACKTALTGDDTKTEAYQLAPCPIMGRYIIIERSVKNPTSDNLSDNLINLAEVYIYDKAGNNLVGSDAVATAGSSFNQFLPNKIIDKNEDTFAHTLSPSSLSNFSNQWIRIDLKSNKPIHKVVIANRKDCCKTRLAGLRLRILDSTEKVMFTSSSFTLDQSKLDKLELLV